MTCAIYPMKFKTFAGLQDKLLSGNTEKTLHFMSTVLFVCLFGEYKTSKKVLANTTEALKRGP